MHRVQRLVLLLQGVLLAALAENMTTVPSTESSSNATGHRPHLYRVDGADGAPCVLLEADVFVSVTWDVSVNRTFATDAELGRGEGEVRVEGGCGAEEATAALAWGAFRLTWTFAKTRGWEKWITKAVELRFDKWRVDHQSNHSEGETTLRPSAGSAGGVLLLSAPLGEAFACDAAAAPAPEAAAPDTAPALELQLGDPAAGASALVRLTRLRLQPFPAQPRFGRSHCPSHGAGAEWNASTEASDAPGLNSSSSSSSGGDDGGSPSTAGGAEPTAAPSSAPSTTPGGGASTPEPSADAASTPGGGGSSSSGGGGGQPTTEEDAPAPTTQLSSTAPAAPALPPSPPPSPPPTPAAFLYGKKLPNGVSAPLYPPKKAFLSGVKVENNEALSDMLWSWYKSGFYTGYYQALQRPKKIY